MSAPRIKKGTMLARFEGDPDPHEVGCLHHRGSYPVGYETRIDPDTDKPRIQTRIVEGEEQPVIGEDGEPVVAQFPVYSEKVGFDPECDACQLSLLNTYEHVVMKRSAREIGELEKERRRIQGL